MWKSSGDRRVKSGASVRMTDSARRINFLLQLCPPPRRYLEIGIDRGSTFLSVEADYRVGVDPYHRVRTSDLTDRSSVVPIGSDEYFITVGTDAPNFDVVFVDGLHTFEQSLRDIENSLHRISEGYVLIDDVVPSDPASAIPDKEESLALRAKKGFAGRPWHGDVFKSALYIARYSIGLRFRTIVDCGNPQMVLWKIDPSAWALNVDDDAVESIQDLGYEELFHSGVPSLFNPASENAALREIADRRARSFQS